MTTFFILFAFFTSLRAVRCIKNLSYLQIFGVFQDGFLSWVIGLGDYFSIPFYIPLPFLQVFFFIDYLLYDTIQLRLKLSYLKKCLHFKSYIESIKYFKISNYVLKISLVVLCSVMGYFFFKNVTLELFSYFLLGAIFLVPVLVSLRFTEYAQSVFNLFFLLLLPKEKRLLAPISKKDLKTSNEKTLYPDQKYPFYKWTYGFYGEKNFDLKMQKKSTPHLIFIFLESFQNRYLNSTITPNLHRLSKEGIFFKNFYSQGTFTERALISTYFGIYSKFACEFLPGYFSKRFCGLPQILKKVGYQLSFMQGGDLSFDKKMQFFRSYGFDSFFGRTDLCTQLPKTDMSSWGVHDEYLFQFALTWLKQQTSPTFLNLLTVSTHHPWIIPHKNKESLPPLTLYQNAMRYTDQSLGYFIQKLRENDLGKNSIIFIMGDHGHPMGEHQNNFEYGRFLYEENIHVPLLILADGKITHPKVISEIGSHIDILPTVLDMLNLQAFNHGLGSSLLRKEKNRSCYFINPFSDKYIGIRKERYKLILNLTTKKEELFNLEEDPHEKKSLNLPIGDKLKEDLLQHFKINQWLYKIKDLFPHHQKSHVVISGNLSDESLIEELQKHPHASFLDLSQATITDKSLCYAIQKLSSLIYLNLSNCNLITDKSLETISRYKKDLYTLFLNECHLVTGYGVKKALQACKKLEVVQLEGVEINKNTFKGIKLSLTSLNLLHNTSFHDANVRDIECSLENLSSLFLDCTNIFEEGFSILSRACKKLSILHLENIEHIRDHHLEKLIRNNPSLNHIILKNAPHVTDRFFQFLSKIQTNKLYFITRFRIENFPKLTDEGLKNFQQANFINISFLDCPNITDRGLKCFEKKSNLSLYIKNCPKISLAYTEHLRKGLRLVMSDL